MGSLSNYAENALLDHVMLNTAFTQPASIYVALSTADPLDDGSGIAEPASNYARQAISIWDAAAARATANTNKISFPEATGAWGTITHFALFDAATLGNMLAHGALNTSKVVDAGIDASFAAGDIDISINSGGMSDYLANALLDHMFKNTAYSQAANLYGALTTASISDSDTGSTLTEPASNYARTNYNNWNSASAGVVDNAAAITFVTASGDWGDVTHAAISDASTGGNMLFYMTLNNSRHIDVGDTGQFDIGTFDISLD